MSTLNTMVTTILNMQTQSPFKVTEMTVDKRTWVRLAFEVSTTQLGTVTVMPHTSIKLLGVTITPEPNQLYGMIAPC